MLQDVGRECQSLRAQAISKHFAATIFVSLFFSTWLTSFIATMKRQQYYRALCVTSSNRTLLTLLVVCVVSNLVLWCKGFSSCIVIGVSSSPTIHLLQPGTFTMMKLGQDPYHPVSENASNILRGRSELVVSFVDKVINSIDDNSFLSLNIRGAKSKKLTKNTIDDHREEVETLRGSIRRIQGRLVRLNKRRSTKQQEASLLFQLTVKYHLATDIVKNIELSEIQEALTSLMISPSFSSEWGVEAVRSQPLQGALLETTDEAWDLSLLSNPTMKRQNVKRNNNSVSTTLNHDRIKNVPLSNDVEFFKTLGVTMADGKPRPGMASKVRQRLLQTYSPH
jgi:hypothetical protein